MHLKPKVETEILRNALMREGITGVNISNVDDKSLTSIPLHRPSITTVIPSYVKERYYIETQKLNWNACFFL